MNDFTKEELEYMANGICLIMAKCSMEKKYYGEVEKIGHKLQSMIDNYCEHDWHVLVLPRGFEIFGISKCDNCGKVKNDNQ